MPDLIHSIALIVIPITIELPNQRLICPLDKAAKKSGQWILRFRIYNL